MARIFPTRHSKIAPPRRGDGGADSSCVNADSGAPARDDRSVRKQAGRAGSIFEGGRPFPPIEDRTTKSTARSPHRRSQFPGSFATPTIDLGLRAARADRVSTAATSASTRSYIETKLHCNYLHDARCFFRLRCLFCQIMILEEDGSNPKSKDHGSITAEADLWHGGTRKRCVTPGLARPLRAPTQDDRFAARPSVSVDPGRGSAP